MKKTMAVLLALAMLFATSSLALASEEYPEHIHMEVANWEANTSGTPKPWEKLENEKFNMDVTWRAEDWGNYQDVIALWGASDELPDVFCGYIDETWFGDFIRRHGGTPDCIALVCMNARGECAGAANHKGFSYAVSDSTGKLDVIFVDPVVDKDGEEEAQR